MMITQAQVVEESFEEAGPNLEESFEEAGPIPGHVSKEVTIHKS